MKFIFSILMMAFISVAQANTEVSLVLNEDNKGIDRHYYDFGNVSLNFFQDVTYDVKNTGTTILTFKGAWVSGIDYRAFHSCKQDLAPNEKCQFTIRYSPMFEGMSSGRFVLEFNEDSSILVNLFGRGVRRF